MNPQTLTASPDAVRDTVRKAYGEIGAGRQSSCCSSSSCSSPISPEAIARGLGYGEAELDDLPEGANLGLSCGNPTALSELQPGETVLDLGSGGGFDVFIAARKVGPTGKAIGVDMTPEMISRARKNADSYRGRTGHGNVEFRLGEIEHLPVPDASVDVVLSNCVINLSPDKQQVWREIARVLKPGGRVAVSDLALLRPLPEAVKASVEALVHCIGGAVLVGETRLMIEAAGLVDISIESRSAYIDQMSEWSDPVYRQTAEHLPTGSKPSDYVTSLSIKARRSE